jgi:regulator of sigma E protease
MSIIILILALVMFVGLVVIHELGHFFAARKGGVDVEEFGLGFPPKAWGKTLKSGLLFTVNWLPLGGFVRLKGEHDSAKAKGSFGAAPLKTKIIIMLAGVGVNLGAAFVLLTILAWIGMPKLIDNQFTVSSDTKVSQSRVYVGAVEAGSPADKAGLKARDRLISLAGQDTKTTIASADSFPELTKKNAGQKVLITIDRGDAKQTLTVNLRSEKEVSDSKKTDNPKGYLGVSPTEFTLRRSTWSAPIVAAGTIKQFTVETFKGLGKALWNALRGHGKQASEQVAGPVSIFVLLKDSSTIGFQFMLMIIAIISLTLAIMNVLPIPALDGGRLFVTLLYRVVLRKPLTQETEERIHGTGFMLLLALMALITIVDIKRL